MLLKWTFECQHEFWCITGMQYSISILTIFCYFLKFDAINHLAKDNIPIRVAFKVSIELVTFFFQIAMLLYVTIFWFTEMKTCEFVVVNGEDESTANQDYDTVKRYFYVGLFTNFPYFFTVFIYLYLRNHLKKNPKLQKVYEYKYVRFR